MTIEADVIEVRHVLMRYKVTAPNRETAIADLKAGNTIAEKEKKSLGVVERVIHFDTIREDAEWS